ncbi:MAG: HEAT repeat domain-containing protein [bacterium]
MPAANEALLQLQKTYFTELSAQLKEEALDSVSYRLALIQAKTLHAVIFSLQGKAEQAEDWLKKNLRLIDQLVLETDGKNPEVLLARAHLRHQTGDLDSALKDFEAAAALDPQLAGDLKAYREQIPELKKLSQEQGLRSLVAESKQLAAEGFVAAIPPGLSSYVTLTQGSGGKKTLDFSDAFTKLDDGKKLEVFSEIAKLARPGKLKASLESETDPSKRLFLESQIALMDGNLPLAQIKLRDFKASCPGQPEDPNFASMLAQARSNLRELSLISLAQLEQQNETLIAQRRNNPEMLLSTAERNYRQHKAYLAGLKQALEAGLADTLEEAQELYKTQGAAQLKAFQKDRVLGPQLRQALVYRAPQTGSEEFWAQKKRDQALLKAFQRETPDPSLFDAQAFAGTAYVKLEGGALLVPAASMTAEFPEVLRIVIGKAGGEIELPDGRLVSFPAGEQERVVLLKGGQLQVSRAPDRRLKLNSDYFEERQSPELIGFEDKTFDALLRLHTREGLEKMQSPEARRTHLLETAKAIRGRNGSYEAAGAILEELLSREIQETVALIPASEKEAIQREVEADRDKTRRQVQDSLKHLKTRDPKAYAARYPNGIPTTSEIDAMVTASEQEKILAKIKKAAFAKLQEKYQAHQISDPLAREAWEIYVDMKDPLDEWFNFSDEGLDRLVDEVVITAVTMPITMGAGAAVRSELAGSAAVLRLAQMGRLGNFGARLLTWTGGCITEGVLQQATNPVTTAQWMHDLSDPDGPRAFDWKEQVQAIGWNVVMSAAFHGGGKLWGKAAKGLAIDETALLLAKQGGNSTLLKQSLNAIGSFGTQTLVASGMGELDLYLHQGDSPQSFFERIGGHGLRMLSMHYGAQVFHAATEGVIQREESLAHARLEAMPQAYAQAKAKGLSDSEAKALAMAQVKTMAIPTPEKPEPKESKKPIQNPPLTPEEARAGLRFLRNPLGALGMLVLGNNGVGGWGGRARERKDAAAEASPDPQLRLLNEELLQLQIKDPDDPAIQEHWEVIADHLQTQGNPQGDLIALELERNSRIARGETGNLASLVEKIVGVRKDIEREINHSLGYKNIFRISFGPRFGFGLEFAERPSEGYSTAIEKFFSSDFSRLFRVLNFGTAKITIEDLRSIVGLKNIQGILSLSLSWCRLGPDCARIIADSKNLRNLNFLDLHFNGIGDDGASAIANSENLRNLGSLNLNSNGIGDDGALAIANSEGLGSLKRLILPYNQIRDEGANAIANSEGFGNLESLDLYGNGINEELERAIAESLPSLVDFRGERFKLRRPPRDGTSSSKMFLAGPALLGAEVFHNGHPSLLGIVLGGITTLLFSDKVRETLRRTVQDVGKLFFNAKSKDAPTQATETKLPSHPNLSLLNHPLLAPFWIALGGNGVGGWGGRQGEKKNTSAGTKPDPQLQRLKDELLQLQATNPNNPAIRECWTVLADYLQTQGNPMGEWIALKLKQREYIAQEAKDLLPPIEAELQAIRNHLEHRIQVLAKDKDLHLHFDPEIGFILQWQGVSEDPSQSITKVLASKYGSLIQSLDLQYTRLGDEGIRALAASKYLSNITHLNLGLNKIGDDGLRAIAASKHLRNLVDLNLSGNFFGIDGLKALAASENLRKLSSLTLVRASIGNDKVRVLVKSPTLTNLVRLNLRENVIGNEGVIALASSPNFRKLKELNLISNRLGREGHLGIPLDFLVNLETLNLDNNYLGPEGVVSLSQSPTLRNLRSLSLNGVAMDEAGAQHLVDSPYLKGLTSLWVQDNDLSEGTMTRIQESFPELTEFNGKKFRRSKESSDTETLPPAASSMMLAGPSLLGAEFLHTGQVSPLALIAGGLVTLLGNGKAREALSQAFRQIRDSFFDSKAKEHPLQNKPLSVEEARSGLKWLRHPLVAMGWMALGIDGFGSSPPMRPKPSFDERRNQLFDAAASSLKPGQEVELVSRILEYSIEDGLQLADRLGLSPAQMQAAVLTPGFAARHLAIHNEIEAKTTLHRPSILKNLGDQLEKRKGQEGLSPSLLQAFEDLYLEAFRMRKPIHIKNEKIETRSTTEIEPEILASEYLAEWKGLLEGRYYAADVLRILKEKAGEDSAPDLETLLDFDGFGQIAFDESGMKMPTRPPMREISIAEQALRSYCQEQGMDVEEILYSLRSSRVLAFRPIMKIKEDMAKQALRKKWEKISPSGWEIRLNPATDRFEAEYNNPNSELASLVKEISERLHFSQLQSDPSLHPETICLNLLGLDSAAAWDLREKLEAPLRALSLGGLESGRAMAMRRAMIESGSASKEEMEGIAASLAGLDSAESYQMRYQLLRAGTDPGLIAAGLLGLDSENSWEMRGFLRKFGSCPNEIAMSLTGIDSDRAWDLRRILAKSETTQDYLLMSLAGLDSERAWQLRDSLWREDLGSSGQLNYGEAALTSLMGLESDRAWKKRDSIWLEAGHQSRFFALAKGLAGLRSGRASQMRRMLSKKMLVKTEPWVAFSERSFGEFSQIGYDQGLEVRFQYSGKNGGPNRYAIQFICFSRLLRRSLYLTEQHQDLLKRLNLVHQPSLEEINKHPSTLLMEPDKCERSILETNALAAKILTDFGRMAPEIAREMLQRNPALPDRAPAELTKQLLARMFPETYAPKPKPSFWQRLIQVISRSDSTSPIDTSGAFLEKDQTLLKGGSNRHRDKRPLLLASDAIDALLVTRILGRLDLSNGALGKTAIPLSREISGPAVETKLTLSAIPKEGTLSLPLPPDGKLVPGKIRGLDAKGNEIPLTARIDSQGKASVDIPIPLSQVSYAITKPAKTNPISDLREREYAQFLRELDPIARRDLTAPIPGLPVDLTARLHEPDFLRLAPKEKVLRIQAMVRELGWYDKKNDEVSSQKVGRPVAEQIFFSEQRLAELRKKDPSIPAKKRFAGVCSDFALITAAMLREAGFAAGILEGIQLQGKEAKLDDLHSCAFLPWPGKPGKFLLIPVDGTPSTNPETKPEEDSTPDSMRETDPSLEESNLGGNGQNIPTDLEDNSRPRRNERTETPTSLPIESESRRSHLRILRRVLEATLYSGLGRQGKKLDENALADFFKREIEQERASLAPEDTETPADAELRELLRDYARRFQRSGAAKNATEAWALLEMIGVLAAPSLDDAERRAFAVLARQLYYLDLAEEQRPSPDGIRQQESQSFGKKIPSDPPTNLAIAAPLLFGLDGVVEHGSLTALLATACLAIGMNFGAIGAVFHEVKLGLLGRAADWLRGRSRTTSPPALPPLDLPPASIHYRDNFSTMGLTRLSKLQNELTHWNFQRRRQAALELRHYPEASPVLLLALKDPHPLVRRTAIESLGVLRAHEAIPHLLSLLRTDEPRVRDQALETLVLLEAKEAIPEIIAALQDPEPTIRQTAARTLGTWSVTQAIPHLILVLQDPCVSVSLAALDALRLLQAREAIPAITQLFRDENQDPDLRQEAIDTLVNFGALEILDALYTHSLFDPDIEIRKTADWAIEELEKMSKAGA